VQRQRKPHRKRKKGGETLKTVKKRLINTNKKAGWEKKPPRKIEGGQGGGGQKKRFVFGLRQHALKIDRNAASPERKGLNKIESQRLTKKRGKILISANQKPLAQGKGQRLFSEIKERGGTLTLGSKGKRGREREKG